MKPAHSVEAENVANIFSQIDRTRLSTELKIKLFKLSKEKDVERFRNLRKEIVYEIFDPDAIIEKNMCYRNEIKEWCAAMQDALVPNLDIGFLRRLRSPVHKWQASASPFRVAFRGLG